MPDLTLIMPFYLNASMLRLQYENWAAWPEKRKRRLKVIIVDDGSPAPAIDVPRPAGLDIQIYRVLEDRPWHQHGARNLGAHVAPEGWMLLTDMDHMFEPDAAAMLFKAMDKGRLDPATIYMLARIEADTRLPTLGRSGEPKPHPNSFVLTRDLFWRIGGYDEDWCGHYGTDAFFRRRAFTIGKQGHLEIPLVRYWRDLVPDASTNAPRKEGRDPDARIKVMAAKRARRAAETDVLTLAFDWKRVL